MDKFDYNSSAIDPSGCVYQAWELVTRRFWLYIGVSLLIILLISCVPIVNWLLYGPLYAGLYYIVFRDLRDEDVEFGQVFKGFEQFVPLMVVGLVVQIPTIIIGILGWAAQILDLMRLSSGGAENGAVFGDLSNELSTSDFLSVIILIAWLLNIFWLFLFSFAVPLVLDRGLGLADALRLSASGATSNVGGMIILGLLLAVVGMIGFLVFCVGIFVAIAVAQVAWAVAYRQIFPDLSGDAESSGFDMPPPPDQFLSTFGR